MKEKSVKEKPVTKSRIDLIIQLIQEEADSLPSSLDAVGRLYHASREVDMRVGKLMEEARNK